MKHWEFKTSTANLFWVRSTAELVHGFQVLKVPLQAWTPSLADGRSRPFHSNITEAEYQKYFLYASAETSPHARIKATYTFWSLSLNGWADGWVFVCSSLVLLRRSLLAKVSLCFFLFGKLQFLRIITSLLLLIGLSILLHKFVGHTEIVVIFCKILRTRFLNYFGRSICVLLVLVSGRGNLWHYNLLRAIFFSILTLLLLLIMRNFILLW